MEPIYVTWRDKRQSIHKWGKELGVSDTTFRRRLFNWGLERTMGNPPRLSNVSFVTWSGETHELHVWAKRLGLQSTTLRARIKSWGLERAMSTPPGSYRRSITWKGETHSMADWAKRLGVSTSLFNTRFYAWGVERTMANPPSKLRPGGVGCSGYRNIQWRKGRQRWRVVIGDTVYGSYKTIEEAQARLLEVKRGEA